MIVAVCGLKRSGKDVVARYIRDHYGYTHVKIAQPLKDVVKLAFGFSDHELESDAKDDVHPVWGVPPRTLLDYIGTHVFQHDIGRVVPLLKDNRCFWINRMLSRTRAQDNDIVISDLRFVHELSALRTFCEENGVRLSVLRVLRDGTSTGGFVSEQETDTLDVDHTIDNNGSLDELYKKIYNIMI